MKAKEKVETPDSNRVVSIVSSLSGLDITKRTRQRDYIFARMVVYKILYDREFWTFVNIGSLFNLDHATVRHAYLEFDDIVWQFEKLENLYKKSLDIYLQTKDASEEIEKMNLQEQVNEELKKTYSENIILQERFTALQREHYEFKKQFNNYKEIIDIVTERTPRGKEAIAAKKINTLLNSL